MFGNQKRHFAAKTLGCCFVLTMSVFTSNLFAGESPKEQSDATQPNTVPKLLEKPLNIEANQTTVSGLSSGGFMAAQFHLAHSDWVQGAGIIAAGPYYCAQNSLTTALSDCIGQPKSAVELTTLNQQIEQWESQQKIAKLDNLKNDKVWLLGGTLDQKVSKGIVSALQQQYANWIPEKQIKFEATKSFAHHFPTYNKGGDCQKSESPFIGNCRYDAAGELLSHLYPDLNAAKTSKEENIWRISTEQLDKEKRETLGDNAYVYVPQHCADGNSCRLHISFHGCNQNADTIGLQFVSNTGYNQWAESNNIVVLYPQTKNSNMMPFNPQGCWDWWGYTDENYANRQGKQIMAIEALVEHIMGNSNVK